MAAGQRERVLELVRIRPGFTSGELSEVSRYAGHGLRHSLRLDRYQVARRLPELEAAGLIRRSEPRICRALGSRQLVWWPVEAQGRLL
jgi:hypothetical protein